MDWLKSTNQIINWVACSLGLPVGAKLQTVIALPVTNVANLALSSLKLSAGWSEKWLSCMV